LDVILSNIFAAIGRHKNLSSVHGSGSLDISQAIIRSNKQIQLKLQEYLSAPVNTLHSTSANEVIQDSEDEGLYTGIHRRGDHGLVNLATKSNRAYESQDWMVKYPLQKLQKEILFPHSCALMGMGFWKALAGFLRSDLVLHPGNENIR